MDVAFAGFSSLEKTHEGSQSIVYRGVRDSDRKRVLLKTTRGPYPSDAAIARLRHEHELLVRLEGAGIVQVLDFVESDREHALVLADIGGISLDKIFAERAATPKEVLHLGAKLARALTLVHDKLVIHKDVNPSNIVWDESSDSLELIDFGISAAVTREYMALRSPSVLEGTLKYISPEQTGRMNRALDHRSDFYSVGATLYELLCGKPPFVDDDPLELVHGHIARSSTPPVEVDPSIPRPVSDIVMRLLEKTAEARYQSARGLESDLVRCAQAIESGQGNEPFTLGADDRSERLILPQTLYGREAEIRALHAAFERVSEGSRELVLVEGYSGIGKTRLVHEVHRPMVAKRGNFISGKFDEFHRGTPYAPILAAIRQLVHRILTETDDVIAAQRQHLLEVLGENGSVLTEVLPELTLILGDLPPVPDLPASEAEKRFFIVFQNLLRALATDTHPLVLFLDDLQWAELSTLQLLEALASQDQIAHLLIIGAYRENEVDAAHPLMVTVAEIEKSSTPVSTISLGPLSRADVEHLLGEALSASPAHVSGLAGLCHDKTGGNPFFLNRFIASLYDNDLLRFEPEPCTWQWALEEIEERDVTDNVVEFMTQRLEELDAATLDSLRLAALIGNVFDLDLLASVRGVEPSRLRRDLQPALAEDLIFEARTEPRKSDSGSLRTEFRFVHDRVQEAAASLTPEDEANAVHVRIGRLMLEGIADPERSDRLFDIVTHMNRGAEQLTSAEERRELVMLDLAAGRRALRSAAYASAYSYLQSALGLLGDRSWSDDYGTSLDLHVAAAEAAHLNADNAGMERYVQNVIENARTLLDRSRAYEVKLYALDSQNDLREAIDLGREVIGLFGIKLPAKPAQRHVIAGLLQTKLALMGKSIDAIADLPDCADAEEQESARLRMSIVGAAYYAQPLLMPLLAFSMVRSTVKQGILRESAFALSVWGLVLCSINDYDGGVRYGELALRLNQRIDDPRLQNRTTHIFNTHLRIWRDHLRSSVKPLREVYQRAHTNGDFQYSAFGAMMGCTISYCVGNKLSEVEADFDRAAAALQHMEQNTSLATLNIFRQLTKNLVGTAEDPAQLSGAAYDRKQMRSVHRAANDMSNLFVLNTASTMAAYLFGNYDAAVTEARRNDDNMEGSVSTVYVPLYHWFDAMAHLAVYDERPAGQRKYKKRALASLKKLKKWAQLAPMNHQHRVELLEAELARVEGRHGDAILHYESSATLAREHGYVNDEALANERAARYLLGRDNHTLARVFMLEARYAYSTWGATAKVSQLDALFGELLSRPDERAVSSDGNTVAPGGTETVDLDVHAVVKSSQAISGVMILGELLESLVRITLELGGARRALLIIPEGEQLVVHAEGSAEATVATQLLEEPIGADDAERWPVALVRYVQRTSEAVILADAREEGLFTDDAYVVARGARSVLCVPIENQGKLRAMLFLENELVANAFTEERVELLKVILAQAAISIENARLYQAQLDLTEAQSRFVPVQFLRFLNRPNIVQVELGDHVAKEMSILFSDLRGFTTFSEKHSPTEMIQFINEYLSYMEPPIIENGGFVDSYVGDAIMALFDGSGDSALVAALGMLRGLEEFNAERGAAGGEPLRMGLGINTGSLMLATIGGAKRFKCGVVGDSVNLASRIESLTKTYGVSLLISDKTHDSIRDRSRYAIRQVDRVIVKGRTEPVTLYEVLDGEPPELRDAKEETLADFRTASSLYYDRNFREALDLFERCAARAPRDEVAALFTGRCARYLEHGVSDAWSGVEQLTHK